LVDLSFQPIAEFFVLGKPRPGHAGRGHHARAQLADHPFPDFRVIGDALMSSFWSEKLAVFVLSLWQPLRSIDRAGRVPLRV
jgi:hypothetical protein